jgi:hypothetical protein
MHVPPPRRAGFLTAASPPIRRERAFAVGAVCRQPMLMRRWPASRAAELGDPGRLVHQCTDARNLSGVFILSQFLSRSKCLSPLQSRSARRFAGVTSDAGSAYLPCQGPMRQLEPGPAPLFTIFRRICSAPDAAPAPGVMTSSRAINWQRSHLDCLPGSLWQRVAPFRLHRISIRLGIGDIPPRLGRIRATRLIFVSNPGPGDKMPSSRENAARPNPLSANELTVPDGIRRYFSSLRASSRLRPSGRHAGTGFDHDDSVVA